MSGVGRLPLPGDDSDPSFAYSPIRDSPDGANKSSGSAGGGGEIAVKTGPPGGSYFDDGKWRRDCSRMVHRYRYLIWFLVLFALYIVYILIFNLGWTGYGAWWRYTDPSSPVLADADPSAKTVVLLGDSLVNRPFQRFDLGAMIRRRVGITDHPLVLWNKGHDGSKIQSIYDRLASDLAPNPSAVILFWDSDASDVDESVLSTEEVATLRSNYESTLRLVLNATLAYPGVEYMAVSGPGVYGSEGRLGKPKRFYDKNDIFDEYREMNRLVASEFGVDYLDARTALVSSVPFYWTFYKWWISIDGEHLNYRGSILWANMASDALSAWLDGSSGSRRT